MTASKPKPAKGGAGPIPKPGATESGPYTITTQATGPIEFESIDVAAKRLGVTVNLLRRFDRTGEPLPRKQADKVRGRLLAIAADAKAEARERELAARRNADPAELALSRALLIATAIAETTAEIEDDSDLDPEDSYRAINEGKTVISAGLDAIRRLRYAVEFGGYPDAGIDDLASDIEVVAEHLEKAESWEESGEIGNRPSTEMRAAYRRARSAGKVALAQAERALDEFRIERSRREGLRQEARDALDAVLDTSDLANDQWAEIERRAEAWRRRDDG